MGRKYYEHYEEIYAAASAADVDRFNNPLDGSFDDLFDRALLPPRGRVLDLGCGEGLYALLFARQGYAVTGVDISASATVWAQQQADRQGVTNVQFKVDDVTALDDVASEAFAVVLNVHCYHCLSRAADREANLRESWRVLAPGGVLVFDNMAAPLAPDMPKFRAWHLTRGVDIHEDESGVTTRVDASPSYEIQRRAGSERVRFTIPTAVSLAHRFYSRMEHVLEQLDRVGFEILRATVRPPDPACLETLKFVHGDNVIYARKPLRARK
jgi:SAM-dependent methyltransferase